MHPGSDCIACHEDEGEGPQYTVAGTVMGDLADPDDCYGVEGVTVRITDADDTVLELVTNAAGNFFTNEPVPGPYSVELELDGVSTVMVTPQTEGSCASCHTQDGLNLAPGRILAP
jgi:mono/diheme cytochrome c family protein